MVVPRGLSKLYLDDLIANGGTWGFTHHHECARYARGRSLRAALGLVLRLSAPAIRRIGSESGRLLHPTAEIDFAGAAVGEVERVGVTAIDVAGIVGSNAFECAEFLGA
jgi:hypothetical protein